MSRLMLEDGKMKHVLLCSRSKIDAKKRIIMAKPKCSAFGVRKSSVCAIGAECPCQIGAHSAPRRLRLIHARP